MGLFVIFAFIEMVENKWILALSLLPRSITLNFNRDKDAYLCWENHLSNMDGDQKRERISCSTSFEPEIRGLSTKYPWTMTHKTLQIVYSGPSTLLRDITCSKKMDRS